MFADLAPDIVWEKPISFTVADAYGPGHHLKVNAVRFVHDGTYLRWDQAGEIGMKNSVPRALVHSVGWWNYQPIAAGQPLVKDGRVVGKVSLGDAVTVNHRVNLDDPNEPDYSTSATMVIRKDLVAVQAYDRSNRGSQNGFYPPEMNAPSPELVGKVMVDLGTGKGKTVEDWRKLGLKGFGVDLGLSRHQQNRIVSHPYNPESGTPQIDLRHPEIEGRYIEADALHTGIADGSVDILYATQTVFSYEAAENPRVVAAALAECFRILSAGGKLRVAPLAVGGSLLNSTFKTMTAEEELAVFTKLAKEAGFVLNGPHRLRGGGIYYAELVKPK